jgi:hypothetical protein
MALTASLLTFVIAAADHRAPLRTEGKAVQGLADLFERTSYSSGDQDLLKARIGFARRIGS